MEGERADQPVAREARVVLVGEIEHEELAVDSLGEGIEVLRRVAVGIDDGLRGVQGERALKDCGSSDGRLRILGEQVVGPLQCVLEAGVPILASGHRMPKDIEGVPRRQLLGHERGGDRAHAGGGDFDRERQPADLVTDGCDPE